MRGPGILSMRGSRFRGAQWLRGRRAQITRGAGLQGARWLPDADRKRRRRKQEAFPSRPALNHRFGPGLAAVCHAARGRDGIGGCSGVDLVFSLRLARACGSNLFWMCGARPLPPAWRRMGCRAQAGRTPHTVTGLLT